MSSAWWVHHRAARERFVTGTRLCEMYQMFTPSRLKTWGSTLPRIRATFIGEDGETEQTGWAQREGHPGDDRPQSACVHHEAKDAVVSPKQNHQIIKNYEKRSFEELVAFCNRNRVCNVCLLMAEP